MAGRHSIHEIQADVGKDEIRTHVKCKNLIHGLYLRVGTGQDADTVNDLPVGALPYKKPFGFVGKPDGCPAQDETDGDGSETVVHGVACDLAQINTQKGHGKPEHGG